jgi:hypothetical protein
MRTMKLLGQTKLPDAQKTRGRKKKVVPPKEPGRNLFTWSGLVVGRPDSVIHWTMIISIVVKILRASAWYVLIYSVYV